MWGRFLSALAAVIVLAALGAPARGFGLRTHLFIADQVWQDLADCRVSVRGAEFAVPAAACRAIRGHRGEFLAGALGPDVFPDVLVGQAIVHPGVPNGWQANDWLNHLLANARTDPELAFAYGYAMHFAGDAFAHSYVNNYAGGVFDISSERTKNIELRHFRLEKYIDQRLTYDVDPAILRVPAEFLSRQLVQYDYAEGTPRVTDFYDAIARDPAAFVRGVRDRLRRGGAAAPINTLLAMRDLAVAARMRTPGEEAGERARLDRAAAGVQRIEQDNGLSPSDTMVFDRRSDDWARLTPAARSAVQVAYRDYLSAVQSWRAARAMVAFTEAWAADIELAMQRYIEASLEFGQTAVRDGGTHRPPFAEREGAIQPYRRWLTCYAAVLRGNPAAAGDLICERLRAMRSQLSLRRAALLAAAGAQPTNAAFRLLQLDTYLSAIIEDIVIGSVGLRDRNFADLLDEGLNPASVTATSLNAAFRRAPNGQLAFRCAIDWIDADLGLRPPLADGEDRDCDNVARSRDQLDPATFVPLDNALVLARLSLLSQDGVRAVATRFGGDGASLRLGGQEHYSLLLDSVRSLDGSQPWQGHSLPFPRRAPYRAWPTLVSAGYAPGDAAPTGFPFYQTADLRRSVFAALFRPYEGSILRRAEMQPPAYPFRPCAGDPLRGPESNTALTEIC